MICSIGWLSPRVVGWSVGRLLAGLVRSSWCFAHSDASQPAIAVHINHWFCWVPMHHSILCEQAATATSEDKPRITSDQDHRRPASCQTSEISKKSKFTSKRPKKMRLLGKGNQNFGAIHALYYSTYGPANPFAFRKVWGHLQQWISESVNQGSKTLSKHRTYLGNLTKWGNNYCPPHTAGILQFKGSGGLCTLTGFWRVNIHQSFPASHLIIWLA